MLVDTDRRERREEMLARKFEAIVIATLGTILPCLLAGATIGLLVPHIFWGCVAYLSVFALFFVVFDRVPVRFYHGFLNNMGILPLLKYAYTSTDRWPTFTVSDLLGFGWLYRRYYRYKR